MNLSSSFIYLPPVPLRLSDLQLNAIRPGLLLIINRFQAAQQSGDYSYSYPYYLHPRPGFDFGEFDPQCMESVCELAESFQKLPGHSRRLQLNAIELAICIFAARVTARQRKHGHLSASPAAPLARIVRTLERYRKRALRRIPAEPFREYSRSWRRLLQSIRVHLLFCGCRKFPVCRNHRYKAIVEECLIYARAGLLDRQSSVPDDVRLRTLVRLALRYVRRDRTRFGIRQLMADHPLAQRYFAEFIIQRETKGAKQ